MPATALDKLSIVLNINDFVELLAIKLMINILPGNFYFIFAGDNMEDYMQFVGGAAGAITLSTVAAAAAYYFATRPTPDTPLVPINDQAPILEVSSTHPKFLLN